MLKKTMSHLKLFSILMLLPFCLALGPCDNGQLPGDPLDPDESTNTKVTPPPSVVVETPGESNDEPAPAQEEDPEIEDELTLVSAELVDENDHSLSGTKTYNIDDTIELSIKFVWSDGSEDIANESYEDEEIQWLSTAESTLKKLGDSGEFKAVGVGQATILVYHPQYKGQLRVKVQN